MLYKRIYFVPPAIHCVAIDDDGDRPKRTGFEFHLKRNSVYSCMACMGVTVNIVDLSVSNNIFLFV